MTRAHRGWMTVALPLALAACGGTAGDAGTTTGARARVVVPTGDSAAPAPADSAPVRDTAPAGDSIPNASKGPGGRPTPLPMPNDPSASAATPPSGDTARGVVAVVGADPLTEVVLRPREGRALRLAGTHGEALRRLAGVELWVRGTPVAAPRPSLDVTQFAVRAVDGVPALDGILADERGRIVLLTADGRRQMLDRPPTELRGQVGARVWVAGATPGEVASYGIIRPRS